MGLTARNLVQFQVEIAAVKHAFGTARGATPEQISRAAQVTWSRVAPVSKDQAAAHGVDVDLPLLLGVRSPERNALYVYSDQPWLEDASPPDVVTFVWDARDVPRGGLPVPTMIRGDDGTPLHMCAISRQPVLDWPVARDTAVFMMLTIARALQVAQRDLEDLQHTHPDGYRRLLAEYDGDPAVCLDRSAQASLAQDWPDLVRVTEGLVTAIAARQGAWSRDPKITGRAVFDELIEQLLTPPPRNDPPDEVDGDVDVDTAFLGTPPSGDCLVELKRVIVPLMRGDMACDGPFTRHVPDKSLTSAAQVYAVATARLDQTGRVVSDAEWLELRRKRLMLSSTFANGPMALELQYKLEWAGLVIEAGPVGAEHHRVKREVGAVLNVRALDGDRRTFTSWMTQQYWPASATNAAFVYAGRQFDKSRVPLEMIRASLDMLKRMADLEGPAPDRTAKPKTKH